MQNTYVSMPNNQTYDDRDSIYQSIEYEVPTPRHQYASIEETAPATGIANQGAWKKRKETMAYKFIYFSVFTDWLIDWLIDLFFIDLLLFL